jgi:MraZ protein
MTRFRGSYEYSVDEKGRVSMPAKFRKALSPEAQETFVVARGPDGCLRAYPLDGWSAFEDELAARAETPETVKFKRQVYDSVSDPQLDTQGRIMLTPLQMNIANISDKAVLVGQGSYLEIWDPQRYRECVGGVADFDQVFYKSVLDTQRA